MVLSATLELMEEMVSWIDWSKGYKGVPYAADSILRPPQGNDGLKGEKGMQGDKGYAGRPGLIGYRGLKGLKDIFYEK